LKKKSRGQVGEKMGRGSSILFGTILGMGIGAVAMVAYNELVVKKQSVPVKLFIEKEDLRNSTTAASIAILDEKGNSVVNPTEMKKEGEYWTLPLKLQELQGSYMAVVTLTPDSKKEFPLVLPNNIGMSMPYGKLFEDKKAIEIRWL